MKPNIQLLYVAIISIALAISCKGSGKFSSRPDPNTSTSGTLGSVKATNGTLPIGQTRPHKEDTVRNH
ncbi:MAG TPA: hypothetical protein VL727_14835 [Puia sp.]|nr:hypothetical protein [Puia sp.]